MALREQDASNLINGVSQQDPLYRFDSQCEEQINAWATPLDGLSKRPPTEHLATLDVSTTTRPFFYDYDRGDGIEKYLVAIDSDGLQVWDHQGSPQTVNTPVGLGYLDATDPKSAYQMVTFDDYTFVVNKTRTVAMDPAVSAGQPNNSQLIRVREIGNGVTFTFQVGTTTYEYTTGAAQLVFLTELGAMATGLREELGAGWSVATGNHTILISRTDQSAFSVTVSDSKDNGGMLLINDAVTVFTDLPPEAPNGYGVQVLGSSADDDDYYVRFTQTNAVPFGQVGEGRWVESTPGGLQNTLDASTMPHVLRREADGTFTFTTFGWADRAVGNEARNPPPSFVGGHINDVFTFRNRLGLLSGQSVITSESGRFENYWRTTTLTVLDGDPLDISPTGDASVSDLRYAVAFNERLILFSASAQYVLSAPDLLTPATATIDVLTEFQGEITAKPEGSGSSIYFPARLGPHTSIREMFSDNRGNHLQVEDRTAHIPDYIEGDATVLVQGSSDDYMLVVSDNNTGSLVLYQYYWQGGRLRQSGWGTLAIAGATEIYYAAIFGNEVVFVLQRGGVLVMEKMVVSVRDDSPRLDGRIPVLDSRIVYHTGNNESTFTMPYAPDVATLRIVSDLGVHDIVSTSGNTVTVQGNLMDQDAYAGLDYLFLYTMSPFYKRIGQDRHADPRGRTQLRAVHLYAPADHVIDLDLVVRVDGRPARRMSVSKKPGPLGRIRFPTRGRNTQTSISIESLSHRCLRLTRIDVDYFNTNQRKTT